MPTFDRYVVVDWSAATRPVVGANSIWICELDRHDGLPRLSNPPTRVEAAEQLQATIARAWRADECLLLGVDASLGAPAGASALFGCEGVAPWRAWWGYLASRIEEGASNRNNRFEVATELNTRAGLQGLAKGPFWIAGPQAAAPGLPTRRPAGFGPVAEFRSVERRLREVGLYPKSLWQLTGPGSVGSQSLTAIPILERLRSWAIETFAVDETAGADRATYASDGPAHGATPPEGGGGEPMPLTSPARRPFVVWPFESSDRGLAVAGASSPMLAGTDADAHSRPPLVTVCEVWPRLSEFATKGVPADPVRQPGRVHPHLVEHRQIVDHRRQQVPDAAQVDRAARWLRRLDLSGRLSDLIGGEFDPEIVDEEGWILGVEPSLDRDDPVCTGTT